ncbi:peptide chain release factor N(5)-glutamine methyltransferase [Adhaeribacter rhizoryzae]|uniref:Release factor glutamine methyltransferase n=1 Tax=Adhaeribacter rhizoryzae TaxID=2607907 RepID=A0A5M6DCI6_9BACT|nr:peptide chain release factor N(5)-glutamine methyltransferase [Adhaeribacter rhizoryzae]KAA5544176.1 peptide chain release factor N(5)-glutamine methyltransferase [Adhaeribacter rhizoryzae]
MKNIQDLISHIRTAISNIYEKPEADALAMQVAEHVLQLTRLQLSTERQTPVNEQTWLSVEKIISRLQQHEPLQYVLGTAHFYGLELKVSPAVLIPRPETEELVDIIIKENIAGHNLQVLDICTGSGCIPIALSAHLKAQAVYGLDISEPALAVAQHNALKYQQPVKWLQQDILAGPLNLPPRSFDIIVSNPPYVLQQEKRLMRANVIDFEPHLALFVPNEDALQFYEQIAIQALTLLKPTGILYFEINENKAASLTLMLQEMGYKTIKILKDMFGKDRFIRATINSI